RRESEPLSDRPVRNPVEAARPRLLGEARAAKTAIFRGQGRHFPRTTAAARSLNRRPRMSNPNALSLPSPASRASAPRTWLRRRSTTVLAAAGGALGALLLGPSALRAETAPGGDVPGSAPATADISGVLIPDDQPSTSPARAMLVVPQAITATLVLP